MVAHKYILFAYYGHTASTLLWLSEISDTQVHTGPCGVNWTQHSGLHQDQSSKDCVASPSSYGTQEMVRYLLGYKCLKQIESKYQLAELSVSSLSMTQTWSGKI